MPPNESSSAVGRLAVALKEWTGAETETGGRSLAEAIANGDPDQLLFWYELLAEVPAEELQERLEPAQLQAALRAIQLIMQWEHAQAEELKETLEREAMETAEREERWLAEREELGAELNGVRGRITTSAGMDDVHEALRAEIEALSAENAQLRQSGRERDRELSEQRDRADELEGRVHAAERERALLSSNQAQLEESIRELNRRLSTQSEASQRGAEWETRKLRQRNEQALILSEQVRELAAQNDELRAEVDRLSAALTEATELLCDNARRFVDFEEQFAEAEKQIELLGTDNHELREQLHQKEKALKERVDSVELSNREFADVVQAKDAQLERQRAQLQRAELEREELRVRLEAARPDRQKEEELERLRLELVSATETARRLFGAAMAEEEGKPAAEGEEAKGAYRAGMELRLRLVQMDRELEEAETAVRGEKSRATELEQALEQKDLHIARLLADCQRYRKMAFGEREEEISHIEKQLEFRDKQIAQLNRRCSELQMELEKQMEEGENRKKKVTIREEPANEQRAEEEPRMEVIQEEVEIVEETREIIVVEVEEEEEQFRIEEMVEVDAREKGEEGPKGPGPEATVVIVPTPKRKSRQQLIREATDMNALHAEIKRLVHELEGRENELSRFHRLYGERELYLVEAMEREARMKRELEQFKALLLFSEEEDGDPLDRLDGSREEGGGGKTATEDALNEARLRERVEVLELENMELRRFRENIAAEGDERDRRMAEGTRRMVYLAVQEAKLGRRVQIGQRLRATMAQELRTMKARLGRVLAGEESRMRHLALENEVKLFELARLQNALLHSVPVVEHNRLLREHKKLLRDKLLSLEDGGYASQEEAQQDDTIEQLYAPDSMDIGRALLAPDSVSALQIRCHRLQEQNDVLSGQNDALQSETQKMAAELAELNAFLDDLEAETELKSMLANIERRFLQALREQFEAAEERESLRRELQRNERKSREAREQWMDERQKLVHTVGQLHAAVQHLHRDRVLGGVSISTVQLEALARRLREQRNRQTQLAAAEAEIERRQRELAAAERAQAAAREAMESVLANNAELDAVHASIQGYQLNVLTLSAELAQTRKKLEKSDRELRERYEELDELRSALAAFQVLQGVDLRALERQLETAPKEGNGQGGQEQRGHSSPIVSPSSPASDDETPLAQQEGPQGARTRVVVVDNTAEWQSQLELVREQARTAMESYKEQLDRREHTLDEYRQLVEQLRAELTAKVTSTAKPATNEEERSTGVNTVRSADELLAAGAREEQWERRVRTLERELHVVVEEKAELEYEKQRLVAEVARERERKKEQRKVRRRDAQVQVNIGGEGGDGRHGQGRGGTSAAKVTTAEENGVAEEYSPFEEEEEDEKKEEQSGGEEGANEEGQEEGDGDSDGSDSGTVEDIQVAARSSNGRKGTALNGGSSSVSGSAAVRSRGSAGTRTLPPRVATATGNEMETLVLRHRNETRKLRMRLIELERRNRELSEQYTALRERSRLAMRPRVTGLSGEAGGTEGLLRRENERLQRQNAHLAKTLETHKEEAEKAADKMRRLEAQSKGSTEIWEERKRHEHAIGALKKRLAEATEHEREMRERLERRERHIEQLNREQSGRLLEGEQLKGALAQWRTEKAELERREKTHVMEKATLVERCRELTKRLEALVRENAKLQRRLKQNERSTEEAEMVKRSTANAETQTDGEQGNSGEGKESGRVLSAPTVKSDREKREQMMSSSSMTKGARRQSEEDPNLQQQQTLLLKQLRRAELLQRETLEKLEVLRNKHEKLVEDYNGLVELERRRGRREEEERARWEREESMGVALLRDKLAAKEREVENQRHKIIDLERKMWRMEMVATRD